jgi:TPR repeat protein
MSSTKGEPAQNNNRKTRRAAVRALARTDVRGDKAEIAHSDAETLLEHAIQLRDGNDVDGHAEAVRIFRRLGDSGCSCVRGQALMLLGLIFDFGRGGVEKDLEEAAICFRKSADLGDAGGMFSLGLAFANGSGVAQSFPSAARWYQKGADNGEDRAQTNLGIMYMEGRGDIPQNYEKGVALLRQATKANNPVAFGHLAFAYSEGTGVEVDMVESARLLEIAATMGESSAQSSLGTRHKHGMGVDTSFAEARRFFEMAAAQGNRIAFRELAKLYQRGQGVKKDLATAKYYLKKAREPMKEEEEGNRVYTHLASGVAVSDLADSSLQKFRHTCESCGDHGENLRMCARCKGPRYCNANCQLADWPEHKKMCLKASIARADRLAADANEA